MYICLLREFKKYHLQVGHFGILMAANTGPMSHSSCKWLSLNFTNLITNSQIDLPEGFKLS